MEMSRTNPGNGHQRVISRKEAAPNKANVKLDNLVATKSRRLLPMSRRNGIRTLDGERTKNIQIEPKVKLEKQTLLRPAQPEAQRAGKSSGQSKIVSTDGILTTMKLDDLMREIIVKPGKQISLKKDFDPTWVAKGVEKQGAGKLLAEGVEKLAEYQDKLYAQNKHSVLVVFQAMDAAGKDGAIKHVMTGLNPQGCQVYSFKQPSQEELDHDYLWRCYKALPERGRIGIFNRSYYEEVLVTRVHPEYLAAQSVEVTKDLWKKRFKQINHFEKHLTENGTIILKFFLYVSRDEQKKRFLERINREEKNWKFSPYDVKERGYWKQYMEAYEDCFNHTSTKWAPWHVIPADNKWFTRLCVAGVIYRTLKELNPTYPELSKEHQAQLMESKKLLMAEKE